MTFVKDCDCPVGAMSGQIWCDQIPDNAGERVVLTAHYDPRLCCMQCHKPWRPE